MLAATALKAVIRSSPVLASARYITVKLATYSAKKPQTASTTRESTVLAPKDPAGDARVTLQIRPLRPVTLRLKVTDGGPLDKPARMTANFEDAQKDGWRVRGSKGIDQTWPMDGRDFAKTQPELRSALPVGRISLDSHRDYRFEAHVNVPTDRENDAKPLVFDFELRRR